MLKASLHVHTAGDPYDNISYSPKELIKYAHKLKYDVLAITCHNKVLSTKSLEKYAKKKGIIMISGIELSIEKKHVLILNVNKDIETVKTFEELRKYKSFHPEILTIAPHPYFPGWVSLKNKLIENIDLFDAIEYSYCYTKSTNFNKKIIPIAEKWKKPIVATSDCHLLNHLDTAYTLIDSKKNTLSIIKAIKKGHLQAVHKPLGWIKLVKILSKMALLSRPKKSN